MKNECLSPVSHIRRAWSSAAKARPAIRRAAHRRAGTAARSGKRERCLRDRAGRRPGDPSCHKGKDGQGTGTGKDSPAARERPHAVQARRTSRPRALRQELEPGIVHRDLPARAGFQPGPDAGMGGGPYPVLLLHHAGIGLTQQHLGRHGTVIGACQPEGELQRQAAGGIPRLQGLADGGQPLAHHTAGYASKAAVPRYAAVRLRRGVQDGR